MNVNYENRSKYFVTWIRHPLSMLASSALYLINKNQGLEKLQNQTFQAIITKMRVKLSSTQNKIPNSNFYSQFIKYLLPGGLKAAGNMSENDILLKIKTKLKQYKVIGKMHIY